MNKSKENLEEYCLRCDGLKKDSDKADLIKVNLSFVEDYYNEGNPTGASFLGVDLGNEVLSKKERDKFYSRRYRRDLKNKSIMPVYRMKKNTKKKIRILDRVKVLDGKIEKLKRELKK